MELTLKNCTELLYYFELLKHPNQIKIFFYYVFIFIYLKHNLGFPKKMKMPLKIFLKLFVNFE